MASTTFEVTEQDRTNLTGLTDKERKGFEEIYEFLCDIVAHQTTDWIREMFANGLWHFDVQDGTLQIRYFDKLSDQMRDEINNQVFDALKRTPNRYFSIEQEN